MVDVQRVLGEMKIGVVIPVHNEAKTIGQIVKALKVKGFDVVVIDDGSGDHSGEIAGQNGAIVLRHEQKRGKGTSLRDGFDYVLQNYYDAVIAMDGDGQHGVDDIEKFIEKAQQIPSCVVTGTRMYDHQGMPLSRLWVNWIMSAMISALCRCQIPDTQCGYRYIGRTVLEKMRLSSCDYEIETEVLIQASRNGFQIFSVPIRTIYSSELSKINPLMDTLRFFVFMGKQIFSHPQG